MTDAPDRVDYDSRGFPGITKAALSLAYDNGGINRERSEEDCLRELGEYLGEHWLRADHAGLRTLLFCSLIGMDRWLSTLSDEELGTACNGEEREAHEVLSRAPLGTDELLNGIFENVG